jgi:2-desacetyl-2-hydroxyethyl bacteriochlorophyllide A dehydrogenase
MLSLSEAEDPMRALVYHGPGDIGVEERPDPRPGPGEVTLKITATGICGSDLHGYTGENKRRHPGQIMGHETVGRVAAAGPDVPADDLRPGVVATVNPVIGCGVCAECAAGTEQLCAHRRVIGVNKEIDSAFAELMIAPARNVVVLPGSVPEEYGALVEPLTVGYHAAMVGAVRPDDAVLVIGGGPIGQAAALAARRLGAHAVVVSEPNHARRALVQKLGFTAVDPRGGDLTEQVRPSLGGAATVAIDAVGTSRTMSDGLTASALGARIVLVGMGAREITLPAFEISTSERSILGSFTYTSREFRQTAEWVASGPAALEHLIDDRVGLDAAPEAFARLASGDLDASKILVFLQGQPAQESRV